jgi:hypothetical protein
VAVDGAIQFAQANSCGAAKHMMGSSIVLDYYVLIDSAKSLS